jgi:3',5'-cyclic AMP phosphodiesterase CpdA
MRSFAALLTLAAVVACSGADPAKPPPTPKPDPKPLPPLSAAKTTLEQTLVPRKIRPAMPDARILTVPENLQAILGEGYGEWDVGPGEAPLSRYPAGTTMVPPAGPNAKRLVRFVHLADLQLADDESPTRLARFDSAGATSSAFRPQEAHQCRILNAVVRTINKLHETTPMDFVLMGGDNADSAQQNELDWVLQILDGAPKVECDSGADDDPVAGPDNDPKDAFVAEGLKMPWRWVTGNHDVLVQGNFVVDPFRIDTALGDAAPGGARDWSQPGGPIVTLGLVPDANRRPLARADVLARVQAAKDGHGIPKDIVASGYGTFTFDVPGTALRFLVLDTTSSTGGSEGLIRKGDMNGRIKTLLDQAKSDGKWVVLASHHAVASLGDGTGLGGARQADAVTADEWTSFVGSYPNVVFSMVGHTHEHIVRYIEPAGAGHAWWEVMTSAIADYPHQFRIVEIWDEDNGFLRMHTYVSDYSTEGDPVALEGKKLGVADYTSAWIGPGQGTPEDRNVDLWIAKPQ